MVLKRIDFDRKNIHTLRYLESKVILQKKKRAFNFSFPETRRNFLSLFTRFSLGEFEKKQSRQS